MSGKVKIELGTVQKTLLIPLWGRALESRKAKPLVRDPLALDLADRLDCDFEGLFADISDQVMVNCAVRAFQMDRALREAIARHPDATIINIGAGLDTTFPRVDNGKIFWYDLDLPDSMALRKRLIPEGERNRCIARSVFDPAWYGDIQVRGSKIILMAAGVLVYLPEADIRRLFLDLAREFPGCEINFEIYAKTLLWIRKWLVMKRHRKSPLMAPFQWGVGSARAIAKWSDRIRVLDERSFYAGSEAGEWTEKERSTIKALKAWNWIKLVRLGLG
jgi:O-methyltransferase involved in polyketide biosynthesis